MENNGIIDGQLETAYYHRLKVLPLCEWSPSVRVAEDERQPCN